MIYHRRGIRGAKQKKGKEWRVSSSSMNGLERKMLNFNRVPRKLWSQSLMLLHPLISFKDKLLGEIPGVFMQAFNLEIVNKVDHVLATDIGDLSQGLIAVNL